MSDQFIEICQSVFNEVATERTIFTQFPISGIRVSCFGFQPFFPGGEVEEIGSGGSGQNILLKLGPSGDTLFILLIFDAVETIDAPQTGDAPGQNGQPDDQEYRYEKQFFELYLHNRVSVSCVSLYVNDFYGIFLL
ncbi:MAG: hypothetical protein IJU47_04875 [Verrucomicrobia bacterium]|nr:hypothetical protein [Verrucomicrobiota bacterium]